jgi:aspartate kinase
VHPRRVREELARGRIVVVAGFQGENPAGEVATLGRGGSDTTAVALAAALDAERCEIYSDVDGIYSADPRIVDGATRLQEISYEEMQELARHGAEVLNPRAVSYAASHSVTIHARSTFSPAGGTVIHGHGGGDAPEVIGVACHRELVRVALDADSSLGDELIDRVGLAGVFRDNTGAESRELLLSTAAMADANAFVSRLQRELSDYVAVDADLGSVSAVGFGVGAASARSHALRALGSGATQIHDSFESTHSITCVVDAPRVQSALRGLHRYFVESDLNLAVA